MNIFKKAFTLAEVLSVLIILGVVAAITIPTTLKKTTERQNRTKVRKAMAAYDKALSQYYLTDSDIGYSNEYHKAIESVDPSIIDIKERRIAINNATVPIKDKYSNIFSDYFNIMEKVPNNNGVFITKDGIMWYPDPDRHFLSAYIAIDHEFVKYLTDCAKNNQPNNKCPKGTDIKTEIKSAAMDLRNYKAFTFIADMPNYAKTPITNPTYGRDLGKLTILDLYQKNNDEEGDNILLMKKLYNYINMQTGFITDAKICYYETCATQKGKSMILREGQSIWVDWEIKGGEIYQSGKRTGYEEYDKNTGEVIGKVDYEKNTVNVNYKGKKLCFKSETPIPTNHVCRAGILFKILKSIDDGGGNGSTYKQQECSVKKLDECE